MEIEKLSYKEAIEKLASMYNFKLTYTKGNFISLDLLEKVNNFYKGELNREKKAYEYLKQRGLQDSTITKFGIGYAPNAQEQMKFFKNANISLKELTELGVLVNNEYPRLIERITFPIFSQNGKIIAFGGRTITNHPAKYINFTNTKIFNKSRTFYGMNFAREHILRKKEIIIVEGYMDVIMLHQAGVENAVATLGTALTKEHLPLLSKINPKVIIAYDSDSAGINAALKASKLLFANFFEGGVVLFEEGMDPADAVKENKNINEYLKNQIPFKDFIIDYTLKKFDLKNPVQKKRAIDEFREYINTLNEILKEELITEIARKMQVSPALLKIKKQTENSNLNKKIDIAEASVIKTVYEKKELLDWIIEYISPEMFNTHQAELEALYQEKFEDSKLLDLVLRDDIMVLDEEALRKQIVKLLIPYYQKKKNEIMFSKEPSDKKAFYLKEYTKRLIELKKGNLVVILEEKDMF